MKALHSLLFVASVLWVPSLAGQNVAIRPLIADPLHEFQSVPGCPTNWPIVVDRIGAATNSPFASRTIVTEAQLASLYQSVGPAFTNWFTTVWANYQATNAAALDARRFQLVLRREALLDRIQSFTNAADFSSLAVPLVASNLVVLRQIEERLNTLR